MLRNRFHFLAIFSLALAACADDKNGTEEAISADAPATIYTGGTIYTGVDAAPTAEAVAVIDGEIAAVGTRDIVLESAGDDAVIVDLQGAVM